MNKVINIGAIIVFGFLMSANVNASLITCTDVAGNTGSGGKNATSSIDTLESGAAVNISNCGPHLGNTTNDLTSALGGFGFDLSVDGGTDGGWVLLDKLEVNTDKDDNFLGTTGGGVVTGTGWGGTSGTFTFADAGYSEYLIGLKFDGVYSMYLSDIAATGWGWNTDAEANPDGGFAISNLTVFVRGDSDCCTTTVPEPASIALMGLGLIGMGATVRRRKKS